MSFSKLIPCAVGLIGLALPAQVKKPLPDNPPQKGQPGAAKVIGLPKSKGDERLRARALVLPKRQLLQKTNATVQPRQAQGQRGDLPITGPAAMGDFVASLMSDKKLSTAELVAEYSLLSPTEQAALSHRAHRLPDDAVVRLARVYRTLGERQGAQPLLVVLHSRRPGRGCSELVQHVLFLSGERSRMIALELLQNKYKKIRAAAGSALVGMMERTDVPHLRALLENKQQGTRVSALSVLARWLDANPAETVDPLLRCLRHRDGYLREQAARHLAKRGDAVVPLLLPLVENPPDQESWFLAALLLAKRELIQKKDLLPATSLIHLARHRLGAVPMQKAVAAIIAGMRMFRDPEGFAKTGGSLGAATDAEQMQGLLDVAHVRSYYPESPLCQDWALSVLRLLTGKDFAADHRMWRAWWSDAKKRGFEVLRMAPRLEANVVAQTRFVYSVGNKEQLWLLGRDAIEPARDRGGLRLRLADVELVTLLTKLSVDGLFDLTLRLKENARRAERFTMLVEGPGGRSMDGFADDRSLRLLVLRRTLDRCVARQAWQEYVPVRLDDAGRRNWWIGQSRALAGMKTDVDRRRHVIDLALAALPMLSPPARQRALERLLTEARGKDGLPDKAQLPQLFSLAEGTVVTRSEKCSLFEVLARIDESPFTRVLDGIGKLAPEDVTPVLRRVIAVGSLDRMLLAMRHANGEIRAAAAGEAVKVDLPAARTHLVTMLADPSAHVRQRVAEACGRLRMAAARSDLLKLFEDEDQFVRHASLVAIARIGGKQAYETLLAKVGPGKPGDRLHAVRGLAMLPDPRAADALVDIAVAHYGTNVGMMALQGLRNRGGSALRQLVLRHLQAAEDPAVRRELVFLLGEMQSPIVFAQLLNLLEKGDSPGRCCQLLAGISGVDYCSRRDRVKRYRSWMEVSKDQSPATWLVNGLKRDGIATSLAPEKLVIGAPAAVIDELCRLVDELPDRRWAIRALAASTLREVTGQDYGAVRRSTGMGARQAMTERYRQFVQKRDAKKARK